MGASDARFLLVLALLAALIGVNLMFIVSYWTEWVVWSTAVWWPVLGTVLHGALVAGGVYAVGRVIQKEGEKEC